MSGTARRCARQWGPALPPAPTSPESESRAGEGLGSSRERFRPRPCGPGRSLGFLPSGLATFIRFPDLIRVETSLLHHFSDRDHISAEASTWPLRVPSVRGHPVRWSLRKSGFGFRLALLSGFPVQCFLGFHPCECPPCPRWSLPVLLVRCRPIIPDREVAG